MCNICFYFITSSLTVKTKMRIINRSTHRNKKFGMTQAIILDFTKFSRIGFYLGAPNIGE